MIFKSSLNIVYVLIYVTLSHLFNIIYSCKYLLIFSSDSLLHDIICFQQQEEKHQ